MSNMSDVDKASETGRMNHIARVDIKDLFMFMGRELESLEEVPAGNILGRYMQDIFFLF